MSIGHIMIGKGPEKVFLLHDWLGDHSNYEPMFPYLDESAFSYALIDLRGYGKSMKLRGEYTVQEAANDVIDLADQIGWEKFHLVGHSMSGMIIQRIAIDVKDRTISCIGLTPAPACGLPLDQETLQFVTTIVDNADACRQFFAFVDGERLSKQWINFKGQRAFETSTPEARAGYLDMWSKTDFADQAKGLEIPFLVVIGEHDREDFNEAVKQFFPAWYPNAELITCKNAGHYVTQEAPVFIASKIEEFIGRHSS